EDDFVAGVGGDPGAQLGGQLGQVLVGQGERQAQAAGFGEQVVDAVGQVEEVVAFVDHQRGVAAVVLGEAGAGGGGGPGVRDDDRPDEAGGLVAEAALGDAGEQDPAVQDAPEVHRRA